MSRSGSTKQTAPNPGSSNIPLQLLLHCEGGLPSYLTPYLLHKYFPWSNPLISNHLLLGIEVRDTCCTPNFHPKSEDKKKPKGYTFEGKYIPDYIQGKYNTIQCPVWDPLKMEGSKNRDSHVTLHTVNGHNKLTPSNYMDIVNTTNADRNVMIYDWNKKISKKMDKRTRHCIERNHRWMGQCLFKSSEDRKWIAPVVSIGVEEEENFEIKNIVMPHLDQLEGIAFIGVLPRESHSFQRIKITFQKCKIKQPNLQIMVLAAYTLRDIMHAIHSGVNVVGTPLPQILARKGCALVMDLNQWEDDVKKASNATNEQPPTKRQKTPSKTIKDLNDPIYERDTSPLHQNCQCMACSQHTCAYLHHLILSKEILADVLLFIHNLHSLLVLMKKMTLLEAGKLEEFVDFYCYHEEEV